MRSRLAPFSSRASFRLDASALCITLGLGALACNAGVGSTMSGSGGAHPTTTATGQGGGTGGTGTGSATSSGTGFSTGSGIPGCTGLQCQAKIDDCATKGLPLTTISGRIYDPAGAVPLYNVYVYVPNSTPDPISPGNPACTQCAAPASGSPVIGAMTNSTGHFTLTKGPNDKWGVPSGANIPLVIQVGKWRRQVTIPMINACTQNILPDPPAAKDKLRLPAKSSEGDMPLIAFTSGCDPAECFLRHIGIDDSEFVAPGSSKGHVHFYTGQSGSSIAGGNTWQDTYAWWAKLQNLKKYDIVFNACECNDYDRNSNSLGGDAYKAMHDYIDGGGRVFSTHYYYNWYAPPTGPNDFQGIANWALPELGSVPHQKFYIDSTFPKGKAFADWLFYQNVTPTYGQITLTDTRYDVNAVTPEATRWIFNADNPVGPYATMYMTFNAPVNQPAAMQCGRGVYSDVHLSGSTDPLQAFPGECANADPGGSHVPNEKALEFLFFDLSSCVQDNSMEPPPPPPM